MSFKKLEYSYNLKNKIIESQHMFLLNNKMKLAFGEVLEILVLFYKYFLDFYSNFVLYNI